LRILLVCANFRARSPTASTGFCPVRWNRCSTPTVGKSAILGANGIDFRFAGIRHNIAKIKSFEGFDIVWIKEDKMALLTGGFFVANGGI
jgi:hypothetical protein